MSAPRSDGGGSAIWVLRAVRGPASHKHSKPKWQRAKALGAGTKGFYSFGLNLCIQPFFVQGCILPMRRCALRAIVRLRGTECMVDCIFLPRTALAIARLVRGYWRFSPAGAVSSREKNTLAKATWYLCGKGRVCGGRSPRIDKWIGLFGLTTEYLHLFLTLDKS